MVANTAQLLMYRDETQGRSELLRLLVEPIAESFIAVAIVGLQNDLSLLQLLLLALVHVELLLLISLHCFHALESLEFRLNQTLDGGGRDGGGKCRGGRGGRGRVRRGGGGGGGG